MACVVLDSSNTDLFVGIIQDNKSLDSVFYECWQMQSEKMIVELDSLLQKHNLSKENIDSLIVSIGPGSYTGVRIAVTIAKVIAVALNCDIYTVSSLRILAKFDKPSICLINARSDRSYFAVYYKNQVIIGDCIKENSEVLDFIKEHPDYLVCGDAEYLGNHGFKENFIEQFIALKPYLQKVDPLSIKPLYLKD